MKTAREMLLEADELIARALAELTSPEIDEQLLECKAILERVLFRLPNESLSPLPSRETGDSGTRPGAGQVALGGAGNLSRQELEYFLDPDGDIAGADYA